MISKQKGFIELKPIRETSELYETIEKQIKEAFKKFIYLPLVKELGEKSKVLKNSKSYLADAIMSGRIQFNKGKFSGRFNASISKELKALGASWDRKTGTFNIPKSSLPMDIRSAVSVSEHNFTEKLAGIDRKLAKVLPEEITAHLKLAPHFDTTLFKVEKEFHKTVGNLTVAPKLTEGQAKLISDEWALNMDKWIKDFVPEEIHKLRMEIKKSTFAGNRYETAIKTIKESYGVSERKAKFLARQETHLLVAKFKEGRYREAGIKKYKWRCVSGTKDHPVRPMHFALGERSKKGETFTWDNPPITNPEGKRNNPGEDFNCRCVAVPIVEFKK